ncbi:capsular polysaccharide export protein, LipB/KpsS family [Oceanicola sp. S124]|uniref:capsular polysaccharide export protein, LipB/KpsS family n=1 Tax=Oceanicola sp. S124 TaxID=1042378 RepID=UPI000255A718|nr:protein fixF [Oceanicola sp. S124]
MRFLKLDTGVIDSFDAALGAEGLRIGTGTLSVLRRLARHRGWGVALAGLGRALLAPGPEARAAIAGNMARKRIRVPALFGNPVIGGAYGYVKRVEAALLRQALLAELAATDPEVVVVYNGSVHPESVLAEVSRGRPRVFIEAGFFPKTLQIDPEGLNGANSVPRDPAFYLDDSRDFAAGGYPDAVNNRASKARHDAVALEPGYVFVPFQVPSDMQVTLHSPWVRDMGAFLDVICDLADRHPDEHFVIKEHPSFKLSVAGRRSHPRVTFANGNVTSELIRDARAVITLNSTVGIEALLLERPVITLGAACYNIEGLVQHAPDAAGLDAAIAARDWQADPRLVRQFIGYLWNDYLVHGSYAELPADLPAILAERAARAR